MKEDKVPFMDEEVEEDTRNLDQQLTKAIQTKEIEEWRLYRSMRNVLYKTIEKLKTTFYVSILRKTTTMWKTVKQLNRGDKSCTPTSISVNNKLVSSPEKIYVAMSMFFYNKIVIIRQGFLKSRMDPIEILKK